jgi:hypothetical protein
MEANAGTRAPPAAKRTAEGAGVALATNGRGPWWIAGASHMHAAFAKS